MSLCAVLQIYTDFMRNAERPQGVWSNEKPALCFRGSKHTYCVVIDFPVRVLRRDVKDFDALQKTVYRGSPYPVHRMVQHLLEAGKHNGITAAAKELLSKVGDGRALFPVNEAGLQLTGEDDTMETPETNQQAQGDSPKGTTEETTVEEGKKKGGKKAKAKAPAKKAVKAKAAAKPAKGKKAAKAKGESKPRGLGIGAFIRERIKAGEDNETIVASVQKKFPGSQAKASSVSWHRAQLKKK